MRILCPHCQQAIVLPDSEAGRTVACPLCTQSFQAPTLAAPPETVPTAPVTPPPPPVPAPTPPAPPVPAAQAGGVNPLSPNAPPPPPIPLAPEPPVSSLPPPPLPLSPAPSSQVSSMMAAVVQTATGATEEAVKPPEGYRKIRTFSIRVEWVRWLPAIALAMALILTFFKWAGLYPGGYSAYTQNAWQALSGGLSVDPVCEKVFGIEKSLKEKLKSDWWLFPYLILLIPGVVLAWLGHFQSYVDKLLAKYPKVGRYWKHRPAVQLGVVSITLLLLLVQYANGFGIQRSADTKFQEEFGKMREEAKTPEEKQITELKIAMTQTALHSETTTALRLSILMHLLALIGLFGDTLLTRRGDRPPPRIGVMW